MRTPTRMLPTKGFKGTDKDMKCRGFRFEVGKVYHQEGKLSVCGNGFHFCEKLEDVANYYPLGDSRYFEIEAYDKVITSGDKSVASSIKLIREISSQEIFTSFNERLLEVVREYQSKNNNLILCGSLAIGLHGLNLGRKSHDIDFVAPFYQGISDSVEENKNDRSNNRDFNDVVYKESDIKIEVSIDPYARFKTVEIGGYKYKIESLQQILAKKLEYSFVNGKHKADLKKIFNQL